MDRDQSSEASFAVLEAECGHNTKAQSVERRMAHGIAGTGGANSDNSEPIFDIFSGMHGDQGGRDSSRREFLARLRHVQNSPGTREPLPEIDQGRAQAEWGIPSDGVSSRSEAVADGGANRHKHEQDLSPQATGASPENCHAAKETGPTPATEQV
jgi:hypothetical protein